MAVAVAVAVAVSGGGAVAVAGLTKRFFNHMQKDFLINVWVYPNRNRHHKEHGERGHAHDHNAPSKKILRKFWPGGQDCVSGRQKKNTSVVWT